MSANRMPWEEPTVRALRRDKVRRLYLEMKMSTPEIADHLGASVHQIKHDINVMGIANRGSGSRNTSRSVVNALSKSLVQLDTSASVITDALDALNGADVVPIETLQKWDHILSRKDNIGAVLTRVRRYIKEHTS